jgi:translocation and assembly module TamB
VTRLRRTVWIVRLSAALVACMLAVLVATTPGTRWLVAVATRASPVVVEISGIDGTLIAGVRAARARVVVGATTIEGEALAMDVDWMRSWARRGLVGRRLDVDRLSVMQATTSPRQGKIEISLPSLPFPIELDRLRVGKIESEVVPPDYRPGVEASSLSLDERWSVDRFSLEAPALVLSGRLDVDRDGRIGGEVDWRTTGMEMAGRVRLGGGLDRILARIDSAAPLVLQADAALALAGREVPLLTVEVAPQDVAYDTAVVNGLEGRAEVTLGALPRLDARVQIAAGDWEGRSITAASLDVGGTLDDFRGDGAWEMRAEGVGEARVRARFTGTRAALLLESAEVLTPQGRADVTGRMSFAPLTLALRADLDGVDPAYWVPWLRGTLSGAVDVEYQPDHLHLLAPSITGSLNGAPLALMADVRHRAGAWTVEELRLHAGENRVDASFEWASEGIEGRGRLNLPDVAMLYPQIEGQVSGEFSFSGTTASPTFAARFDVPRLAWQGVEIEAGHLRVEADAGRVRSLDIDATRMAQGTVAAEGVEVRARGRLDAEAVALAGTLAGRIEEAPVRMALRGEYRSGILSASLARGAELGADDLAIRLDRDVAIAWRETGAWSVAAHCWERARDSGRLCVDTADGARVAGRLEALPVALVAALLPGLPDLAGGIVGEFDVAVSPDVRGSATLRTEGLALRDLGVKDDATADVALADIDLRLALDADRARLTGTVQGTEHGTVATDVSLEGLSTDGVLAGEIRVEIADVSRLAQFSRRIGTIGGSANGRIALSGTLGAPAVTGELAFTGGHVVLVDPHFELSELAIALTANSLDHVEIAGSATGGAGPVRLSGQLLDPLTETRHLTLTFASEGLDLTIPEGEIRAKTDLALEWRPGAFDLSGQIDVPRARIELETLPESSVRRSPDVVVVDREIARPQITRLAIDVRVALGKDVRFEGFGLDTRLTGRLRLRETRDGAVRLNGTLNLVDGTFTVFGQTLTIERGRLSYAGPLDSPSIDARAVRRIERDGATVVAGVNISGRAQAIESTLFSTPPMPDSQVLSYLVAGRPLDEATSEEGSDMSGAAIALGLKGAAPVVDEIRNAVGLEELTAKGGGEELALIAGKRISKTVFVRYTYQTFTRMSALLVELALTDRLRVEATAAEAPSMDLMYRVGRGE